MNIELRKYYERYIESYKSQSQLARVVTENWFIDNMYCPFCTSDNITDFPNNYPVADFYCNSCKEEFQLKSKKNGMGRVITDGEYNKMIDAIYYGKTPNFFFLNYTFDMAYVNNLLIVPKEFILPTCIKKRKPLSKKAKRAGWTGCNILLNAIPDKGKIYAIRQKKVIEKDKVRNNIVSIDFIKKIKNLESRGWLSNKYISLYSFCCQGKFVFIAFEKKFCILKNCIIINILIC
ncbi:MAG: hypothetical protein PWQ37_220 [Candidatus Petromonas sp.]|jgi:type II restriction enzyme|nr:hypothetical protein [Candidatus Petromonas sp.]